MRTKVTYYAVTRDGLYPCRQHATALALVAALGGVLLDYDPRAVLVPPEPVERPYAALAA